MALHQRCYKDNKKECSEFYSAAPTSREPSPISKSPFLSPDLDEEVNDDARLSYGQHDSCVSYRFVLRDGHWFLFVFN